MPTLLIAVQTPGAFLDRDCEIMLWNGIGHIGDQLLTMDLRNSDTDIMAIQRYARTTAARNMPSARMPSLHACHRCTHAIAARVPSLLVCTLFATTALTIGRARAPLGLSPFRYLTDRILGQDEAPPSDEAAAGGGDDPGKEAGWMEWLTGNSRQIDAAEANRMFHEDIRLLQGSETVEMAFKASRDTILFTQKRMVMIDKKGITGKQVEYKSIPWSIVQAFAVQSSAAIMDIDSEMMIWTDVYYTYRTEKITVGSGDNQSEKTIYISEPGPVSYISIDFQKDKVDLASIGRYLASRCAVLGFQSSQPPTPAPEGMDMWSGDPGMIEGFINWLGDDYRVCDPAELDEKLHGEVSFLLPDEAVQMGFICGRDTIILTTHRAMKIDKKGFTGKKVLYLSLPWSKIKKYQVRSAGSWDLDAEMELTIKAPWFNKEVGPGLSMDLARCRSDVLAINTFVSQQVIGGCDGTTSVPREVLPEQPEGLIGSFLSWLGDNTHQISAEDATAKFTSDPAILLEEETVEIAFKCGADFYMATTKRWIKVDGDWKKNKVTYMSVPIRFVPNFDVTTPASNPFDQDAEITMNTDSSKFTFDVKKDQGDIMQVYTIMNKKCVMDRLGGIKEPEYF